MQANGKGQDRNEILEFQLGKMFEPDRMNAIGLEAKIKNSPDIPENARSAAFKVALSLIKDHFRV